ncbi:MAG TPA: type 1 glutamine amidotransferase [Candidatus Hydrogenedentes bacterium]|nr:type 1 glutamine amidotransferase [Candidatus Hydrogenedentota bacterium]
MAAVPRFLIVDGYPKASRDEFNHVGMRLAWELYRDMLLTYLPDAEYDVWLSSDPGTVSPASNKLEKYAGVLWPGCNITIYHHDDPRVIAHLDLAQRAYEVGVPQFGTCWGIQLAVVAAGGEVKANPKGREMGIGRKIRLTEAGRVHPMYEGKPAVFDGFVSHDDEVTKLPPCATLLAGNDFSEVQAVSVTYKRGTFWGIQYHPEYDVHEMARLIVAREERLTQQGFFRDHDDMAAYVDKLEALHAQPDLKSLRWQLGIDDTILSAPVRQREFINWLDKLVLPCAGLPPRKI